jgi:PAS domain S-box-containing protein
MQGSLSLQTRLALLVVAAMLPLAVLSVWFAVRANEAATGLAQSQLKFSASVVAAHQDRLVESAQQLLGAIATMPGLRDDPQRCTAYFSALQARYPAYSDMGILDLRGQAICNAVPYAGAAGDASDRMYFRKSVAERRPVMGFPVQGRASHRFVIPFAQPIMEGDKVLAVAFVTLDLANAAQTLLARLDLPPDATVRVTDRRGQVLVEHPDRPDAELPVLRLPSGKDAAGAGELLDPAGRARIYGYASSRQIGGEGFVASVTLDRARVTQPNLAELRNELSVLGLTLLAGIAAAWWLGRQSIVRPAKQILGTVRRLEQGRLDARVPLQGGLQRGEFARIGAAFNLMAQSLELRQVDLQAELGRSRGAYGVLDLVLNSMQEGLLAVTSAGEFLMFNEAAARLFPLNGPPLSPHEWARHFGIYHVDGITPYEADELPLVRSALGESGRQQLLFVRNALVPEGRLLQCSWQPIRSEGGVSGGLVVFTDVTELQRLQAEQAAQFDELRETQRKLIEAQRIGRVGNWELDLRTGQLWWSDEVHALFGTTRERFAPTVDAVTELIHPDDRALLKVARDAALCDGKATDVAYRVPRPDGTVAWMHEVAQARRDDQGELVWFGGMVQDITSRKQSEQALLESERELHDYTLMLQRAAEAAHVITAHPSVGDTLQAVAEQARRVIGTRGAAVSLLGQAEGDAGTCRCSGDEPDANSPGSLAVVLVGRSGQTIGQLVLSGKDDGDFTQRDRYVAMQLAQLASIAIENAALFTQVRDLNAGLEARISERTAELTRQEQLYRTLAEQAPEVVWNTDARGRAAFFNRAWYDLVGGEQGQWLDQGWQMVVHPDDLDEVRRNWAISRATLQPYTGTRRLLAKDGSYHTMSYKATPVLDEQGAVAFWVGIDADITAFKAIESALRSSNQELEAFSYSVSHDLRAPLGAIDGFSRALALKLEGQADERVRHYLERIQAGVEKMGQLIESLLSLAKVIRAPLDFGAVDLSAMAREILEELRLRDPQRSVAAQVQEGLVAQGDERLLRVAMENLLGNAWKFTSRTASAVIDVGKRDNSSVFFGRDHGVGFDMAYADKLFAAFQRLHTQSEFPGTGIGLATVSRIVARHQGRVWAESRLGRGTTFFFALSGSAPPAWLAGA